MGLPDHDRWCGMNNRRYLEYLALAALFITFFGFFAVKVWDIDFWWHIAAGRNILDSGVIPSKDPFGVYDADNACGQTVLKSEWLGQVLLYLPYRWFELDGIIFLRASVLAICLAIVYLRCRLTATGSLFSLAITALAGLAILHHTGERPQLFSFLYMALIFLLLDEFIRSGKRWLLYCVPVIMLLWSNTHAGAVLGTAALGLFSIGYMLEYRLLKGSFNSVQIKLLFMATGMSVIALILAPSGFATFECILIQQSGSLIRDRVSEYASPWALWPVTLYYWLFIGVALTSLPGIINKTYLKQGAMVIALGTLSIIGYRFIPLFVLAVAPYVAASLDRLLSRIDPPRIAVNLLVLIAALAFLAYGYKQGRIFQHGSQENKFPAGAVAHIEANKLGGKIFNTMNWGGYLIWKLPGIVQIFIDGRTLDSKRTVAYTHILWMTPEGQQFFEQENFDLALVPYGNVFTGERYPLVAYLSNHPDWQAVYQDATGYLFTRRTMVGR